MIFVPHGRASNGRVSHGRVSDGRVVKGSGRGGQQQQRPALGEEGDFAVHASVYGKVQAEPDVTLNDQRERKGKRKMLLACPSWAL
jgi:hypothetical protein